VQLFTVSNAQWANATFAGQEQCQASCTSVIFRQLSFGQVYVAAVYPTNATGTGAAGASGTVDLTTACTVGACVTVDATDSVGPANHADSGIGASLFPVGQDQARLNLLGTTMYRGAPTYNPDGTLNWSTWNVAVSGGSQTTLILSNLWYGDFDGDPVTPWSNWGNYAAWVTETAEQIVESGEQVNYWDPYNEPGGTGFYSAANFATVTPALLLEQFLVTYEAIKSVDPTAAIIGPSLAIYEDFPNEYGSDLQEPDMVTFLNYAAANHLQLAAVSWHEIDDSLGPNPSEDSLSPANLEDHVAEVRSLIAARPSLGNPQIFINEYGMPEVQLIPGWDVSYLAALTDAGVDSAGRACWGSACTLPTLDGLLDPTGNTPQNDYWVRQAYAEMSGNMVRVTSDQDTVTGLASFNASTGQLSGLIGRAVGCTQDPWCASSWPSSTDATPTVVNITVTVPWTSGQVNISLSDIPGEVLGDTALPIPATSTASVTPNGNGTGTFTLSIPTFADGDAYAFSVAQVPS
jgi:hypothetical protein